MAKMFAPTEFLQDVRRYVVINSTDEWLDMCDQGTVWGLPPSDVVVEPSTVHPRAAFSHKDPETGYMIPGTLVVQDQFQNTVEGSPERMVDVEQAIKTSLGYDPRTGEYPEGLGLKGVSVVPFSATREQIEAVRAEGLERFRKWKIKECIDLVDAHDMRNEARKKANLGEVPPSFEYVQATAALDALKAEEVSKYRQKFGLKVDGQVMAAETSPEDKKKAMIDAFLENPELVRMLATAMQEQKLADVPGVSAKTAEKLARVEREMADIKREKDERAAARKFKAPAPVT